MFSNEERLKRAKELRAMSMISAESITDEQALTVKTLYPTWKENEAVATGDRRYYAPTDLLYKCTQAHTTQPDWTPDLTPALWTPLDVEHGGTLEAPIPAVAGMEYSKGKYYIEDDVIYLMNREGMAEGESVTLQYLPSQLVGQYFEIVE